MQVRIIKNNHPNTMAEFDLNNYKGEIFQVVSKGDTEGSLNIDFGSVGTITIYDGEYEIIDARKGLEDLMRKYPLEYALCGGQNLISFMLERRDELVKILR